MVLRFTLRWPWRPASLAVLLLGTLITRAGAEPLELSRQLVLSDPPLLTQTTRWSHLPSLRKGSQHKAVGELTQLIQQSGLWSELPPTDGERFGADLETVVKNVQQRLGLKPDGIAGPQLYANLETTGAAKRAAVESFAIRLEHLAHEARQEGRRKMVVINVPSFTLRAIDLETGKTVVESPVIVGRKDRQTPIGRLNIVALTINPVWRPPAVVMKHDILPRLGKNPAWWAKHPLLGVGPDRDTKPGEQVTAEDIAAGWKFVQASGKNNALGRLKFETDSRDNIFLHDTSDRALFANASRTHSSGCVRVKNWQNLAAFLAESTTEKIIAAVEKKDTRGERIPGKVPVFIEYSQGDVVDGKALYFPDIYQQNPPPGQERLSQHPPAETRRTGG